MAARGSASALLLVTSLRRSCAIVVGLWTLVWRLLSEVWILQRGGADIMNATGTSWRRRTSQQHAGSNDREPVRIVRILGVCLLQAVMHKPPGMLAAPALFQEDCRLSTTRSLSCSPDMLEGEGRAHRCRRPPVATLYRYEKGSSRTPISGTIIPNVWTSVAASATPTARVATAPADHGNILTFQTSSIAQH